MIPTRQRTIQDRTTLYNFNYSEYPEVSDRTLESIMETIQALQPQATITGEVKFSYSGKEDAEETPYLPAGTTIPKKNSPIPTGYRVAIESRMGGTQVTIETYAKQSQQYGKMPGIKIDVEHHVGDFDRDAQRTAESTNYLDSLMSAIVESYKDAKRAPARESGKDAVPASRR